MTRLTEALRRRLRRAAGTDQLAEVVDNQQAQIDNLQVQIDLLRERIDLEEMRRAAASGWFVYQDPAPGSPSVGM